MPEQQHDASADLDSRETETGQGRARAVSIAGLKAGELVIDLGSSHGSGCLLAAQEVGAGGQVIGVDKDPEKIAKAKVAAEQGNYANVDFRLGEIERLPIANEMADVVISGGVMNLSFNKPQLFREAYRVLKFGGRLAISDVVATAELPEEIRTDERLAAAGIAKAEHVDDLAAMLEEAGFEEVKIEPEDGSREFIRDQAPGRGLEDYVVSATIAAAKLY